MSTEIAYLLLAGFFGGFLAGMLGIGGGVIYILILPIAFENAGVCNSEVVAYTIANSVFAIFIASVSGNVSNIMKGKTYWKEILLIGIPASLFSIVSMMFIVKTDWYSKDMFNIVVLVLLSYMLIRLFTEKEKGDFKPISNSKMTWIGTFSGIVSALSGLGGGIIIVPMLKALFGMDIKRAKDISLGVIGVMAFSLSIYNLLPSDIKCYSDKFQVGYVVFPVILIMIVGVIIGSPLGIFVSNKLKGHWIKYAFIALLILVIVRKLLEIIPL